MTVSAAQGADVDHVRVLIVDDAEDMRVLLRLQLKRDRRFVVVGEASDGVEAIAVAEREQPDLIILDRQMPRLGGLEALPEIRRRAPGASIVLYTANTDPRMYQAALDAGALDVLDKVGASRGFVDQLVSAVRDRARASASTMDVSVGPISSQAARVWVANTRKIIDAVAEHPEIVGETIPPDVIDLFRSFLDEWDVLAHNTEEFSWEARANPEDVSRIVTYWAAIDAMTDEQLERLSINWAPPEGEPFFHALTTGVLAALKRHEETQQLAARLDAQWAPQQQSS